ncbi:MAG TPA: tetratricopeptide repeat protein [Candidatus Binatia bacterium]|nr:tetratricopeptide repeat protein [Candidatus Binatia bacterium]
MPRSAPGVDRHLLRLGAVGAAIGLAYASSFRAGFVLDSRALVLENPVVHALTAANVRSILGSDYWQPMSTGGLYRPVTILSYLLNATVLGAGRSPAGYHAVNLVLHVGCASLLYALVVTLGGTVRAAVVAAALFGLHPIATEAVTNIVGRADLLATLGVLGGVLCHARAVRARGSVRVAWCVGLGVAAIVALFSKESGLVLVAATLAWDLIVRPGSRVVSAERGVTLAVLAAYLAARSAVARAGFPPEDTLALDNPLVDAGFVAGRLTALRVLGLDLLLLLWPRVLSADYSDRAIPIVAWPPGSWADWQAPLVLVALAAIALVVARLRRREPSVAFLVVLGALALLPGANLLVLIGTIRAERFLYLPLAAFAAAATMLADRARAIASRRVLAGAATVVLLVACAWRTWTRNADWRDELSLWASTVVAVPASAKAHKAYAAALFAADGDRRELPRVIAEAEHALAIRPDYVDAAVDLGSYYLVAGDRAGADAARWYERSVTVLEAARRLDAEASRRFQAKMAARGRPPDAIPDYGNLLLHSNLALAYLQAGRLEDARAAFEHARRLDPANPARYRDVSAVLARLGRWEDAAVPLFEALTLAPDDGDSAARLVELYRTFHPDPAAAVRVHDGRADLALDDAFVRRHRCRAFVELAELQRRAQRPAIADRARALATRFCFSG